MKYHLAFDDKTGDLIAVSSTRDPNITIGKTGAIVIWAVLDEEFDPLYKYTHLDGVATKGDLIPVDEVEENRKIDESKAIKYRWERQPNYPDIGDQLDDLYKKGAFSTEMTAKIKAVKDAYPKPS